MRKFLLTVALAVIVPAAALAQTAPRFLNMDQNDMVTSSVVGLDVYDSSKTDIGQIKDVVVEASKVKGYILSVGGFLGMGTRYVAVDTEAVKIKYDVNDKKWHANMDATKDQLKSAPEFKYEGRFNASKS